MITPPTLTILIPVYNDAEGLQAVLNGLSKTIVPGLNEVLIVDDGSTDDIEAVTARFTGALPVRVIRHPVNRGYGAALKTGIRNASEALILTMDADGQHAPEDAIQLIGCIREQDMIIGERDRASYRDSSRQPGKWVLGRLANYLTQTRIPDFNSGLRLFRREVMRRYIHLLPDGFSASTTMTMVMLKRGYGVAWRPITARARIGGSSRVRQMRDGFGTMLMMIRMIMLFDPLRVFLPAGGFIFMGGVISGVYYFFYGSYGGGVSVGSLLLLLTGMLLFFVGIVADQISALRLERYE